MNYILVAIFLWCNVSSVRCIFGVMYMHFWYAMHRHLWWCLVGAITIVQCMFGALFLGLGCNMFLVVRLWCYALSAISRRLATAVAHLLYLIEFQIHIVHRIGRKDHLQKTKNTLMLFQDDSHVTRHQRQTTENNFAPILEIPSP